MKHDITTISFHASFANILGPNPTIELLLAEDYAFAHEAGVFIADRNELYVTSNWLFDEAGKQFVEISRIILSPSVTRESVQGSPVLMANGAVNHGDGILFCDQGGPDEPSGVYHTSLNSPTTAQLLISSVYDRPFNSVNDVVVHTDGSIWFTDPAYGFEQGYRPTPCLPSQVYRFQPNDLSIRAMADGFGHPNGICFSPDEKVVYVTDTDWQSGYGDTDNTKVSSIYAFDVTFYSGQPFLRSKRLFAMCDVGIPDGIKCDLHGNVYSGCGGGLNVWSAGGMLLGKILLDGGVANFCFGRSGELYLLNEQRLWRAQLSSSIRGALLGI
ncbi:hypothetical protein CKM354_000226500 [Cercospora kikuchii]|uniref:SMP-30/Gluconolactonase/LRE-like region domain-containing protein n=1 Tax=Cercospora kikuchii TaxID=84275 RepID=A0A9P3F940_9PEZI|nr:uncharacterized protein CKM354_000226500 [Cercospora kikuchii]GIZ38866.1 hypothetical protein CKM354_000226500 [Cercospora kikuchii]